MQVKSKFTTISASSILLKERFTSNIIYSILVAVFGFLLYSNTIFSGYVLDDAGVITNNEYVQQGFRGICKILNTETWHSENIKLGYYRPLSLITFAIENQFFGTNAQISHLVNVLLYALTAFFICLLLMDVFKKYNSLFAVAVTLLFIAHPIHTEVVANIKSRDEILSLLNLVLSAYFLLKASKGNAINFIQFALSSFFFYLALLSKESAVTGIFILPLLLFFTQPISIKKGVYFIAPFVVLAILFQIQKYVLLGGFVSMTGSDLMNYPYAQQGSKIANVFMVFAYCLKFILVPHPLCYSYAYNQLPAANWGSASAIIGLLSAAIILSIIFKYLVQKTTLALGLLWFMASLIPALGFVFLRGGIFAERFLYAPVLGFAICFIYSLAYVTKPDLLQTNNSVTQLKKNFLFTGILGLTLLLYSFKTVTRNLDWKSDYTLVSQDIKVGQNNSQIKVHYGTLLMQQAIESKFPDTAKEYFNSALSELNAALQINAELPDAYFQIGQGYEKVLFKNDSAIYYYNRAILQNSNYAFSYLGLGNLYRQQGKQEMASYYYNKAVEMNPNFALAVTIRTQQKATTGLDIREFPADKTIINSLADTDKDFSYYNNLGKEYGQKGDFISAILCFEKAVELNPTNEDAYVNLSVAYGMTKQYEGSIKALTKVLELNPANTTALTNLAIIYKHIGNQAKADELTKKLQQLNGN